MNAEGLAAARRYARWNLGDSHWADSIIRAYEDPEAANKMLDGEQS